MYFAHHMNDNQEFISAFGLRKFDMSFESITSLFQIVPESRNENLIWFEHHLRAAYNMASLFSRLILHF